MIKKIKFSFIGLCLIPLLYANASVAEPGTALKNDSLRTEPYADAKITGKFNRGDNLDILQKKGAWLQIKLNKNTGWVRALSVKRGTASSKSSSGGLQTLASGRAGTGQVVSTTGVRGLSEQELKAAKFNESEVKLLESYTLTPEQGQAFAVAGHLKTVKFSNLKAGKGDTK
ncbi:MAG: ligand-binding protein SH3 [Betaproteobacteria bacterium HGW-Betaproteobacteria-22]|nr:MAG: ligand-binding protein SH3 [Betaproteobacteria bacterium HGW-Betaproteobacteria-22]